MDHSPPTDIEYEFLPLVRIYKNGHVERLHGIESIPPGTDSETGVLSKDINILPGTEVYVRVYIPNLNNNNQKLPVVLFFHGGGFIVSAPSSPSYHNYLNKVVAEARVVAVSVHYRRAPEHPLPIAYEDSWAALRWVVSHSNSHGSEAWLNDYADFRRLFLTGESSGANIAHNLAMAAGKAETRLDVDILGIALIHPYFWGSDPVGSESLYPDKKAKMDKLWPFVCPSNPDNDDPRVNPVAEGAVGLMGLGCRRVLVCVAEKDILRDRGWLYHQVLGRSGWTGVVEIHESEGQDHVFHLQNLQSEKAKDLITTLAAFFNKE